VGNRYPWVFGVALYLIANNSTSKIMVAYNTHLLKETQMAELQIEDTEIGKGKACKAGDFVSMHYTGWLTNGNFAWIFYHRVVNFYHFIV
jgi:hypothetical protein